MDPIVTCIDRLEEIVGDFKQVARTADNNMVRDILALRSAYAAEIAKLFTAVAEDARLKANPQIAEEFQRRFMEARHLIAKMQTRWRVADIENDPHGYLEDIRMIDAHSAGAREWGKRALQKAAA
ncbi:hypothetical protein [Altererythrobacter sp.]|uniref:hypothetical protein n=1 Tax=Altererythrobacter sp. TaxID=1872480 RepID=UPI003CFFBC39